MSLWRGKAALWHGILPSGFTVGLSLGTSSLSYVMEHLACICLFSLFVYLMMHKALSCNNVALMGDS